MFGLTLDVNIHPAFIAVNTSQPSERFSLYAEEFAYIAQVMPAHGVTWPVVGYLKTHQWYKFKKKSI